MTNTADNNQHATPPQPEISMTGSHGFWHWLNELHISLVFTIYQTNRLFLICCKP